MKFNRTRNPRRRPRLPAAALAAASALLLPAAAAAQAPSPAEAGAAAAAAAEQAAEPEVDYFAQFANAEVPIKDETSGGRTLNLIRIANEELEVRQGPATLIYPMSDILKEREKKYRFKYIFPREFQAALRLRDEDDHARAVPLLRKSIYPLVKFMDLPKEVLNVHELVKVFVESCVKAEMAVEAGRFIARLPLADLDDEYFDLALEACQQLVDLKRPRIALGILASVPYNEETAPLFPRLMDFARILRYGDHYAEALIVYEQISKVEATPEQTAATLWVAYCHAVLDRLEVARLVLTEVPELKIDNDVYALHKLVLTRLNLADNNYDEAMVTVSESVVFTNMGHDWAAETLFVSGQCYEHFEKIGVARSIYDQIELFFPNDPWQGRAVRRLEVLPEVSNTAGTNPDELLQFPAVNDPNK